MKISYWLLLLGSIPSAIAAIFALYCLAAGIMALLSLNIGMFVFCIILATIGIVLAVNWCPWRKEA
jgi:hypothetical protein